MRVYSSLCPMDIPQPETAFATCYPQLYQASVESQKRMSAKLAEANAVGGAV